jgi:hypothetical protein
MTWEVKPEARPGATQGKKTLWVVLEVGENTSFTEVENMIKKWVARHSRDYGLQLRRLQEGRA